MTEYITALGPEKTYSMADVTLNSCDVTGSREKPRNGISEPDSPDDEYWSGSDRSFDDEGGGGDSSDGLPSSKSDDKKCVRRMNRHGSHGSRRRHKGGSRHKKIFQPYPTSEDINANLKRKSMERKEKEFAAAEIRKDVAHDDVKFPVAPFNSTQFLMDEHCTASPYQLRKTPSSSRLVSMECSQNQNSSSTDCEIPLESLPVVSEQKNKEFDDILTSAHAESLQSLSKDELVKHYMGLEEKVAALQKQMAEVKKRKMNGDLREEKDSVSSSSSDSNSLSSGNEDYIDISSIQQPSISVGDSSTNE